MTEQEGLEGHVAPVLTRAGVQGRLKTVAVRACRTDRRSLLLALFLVTHSHRYGTVSHAVFVVCRTC